MCITGFIRAQNLRYMGHVEWMKQSRIQKIIISNSISGEKKKIGGKDQRNDIRKKNSFTMSGSAKMTGTVFEYGKI